MEIIMKKSLLLAAALCAVISVQAEKVITEYNYSDWVGITSTDDDGNTTKDAYGVEYGAVLAINNPVWHSTYAVNQGTEWQLDYKIDWDDDCGLMVLGNANQGSNMADAWGSGTQIVNLGGSVGKVLCIAANSTDVVTALQSYSNSYGSYSNLSESFITKGCTAPYAYIHWFVDSLAYTRSGSSTATSLASVTDLVRVDILLNLYESDYENRANASKRISSIYGWNGYGAVIPSGSNSSNDWIYTKEFWTDSTSTASTWSPDIWMKYTFYTWSNFDPFSACIYLLNGGSSPTWTLFIKSITFTQLEEGDTAPGSYASTKTMYTDGTYYVQPTTDTNTTGITEAAADETPTCRVSGQNVTFDGRAMIYTATGALVGYAEAGETTTLSKGFYVARVGDKGVKFVVQ